MKFLVGADPWDSTHYSKVFGPDNYQEEPPQVIGHTLSGKPVRQGYLNLTFLWSYINQDDFDDLMEVFDIYINNGSYPIRFTYIDKETGKESYMQGMMHEPLVGMRQFVYYANVAVRLSHCEEVDGP
jgi:hypothetical protein